MFSINDLTTEIRTKKYDSEVEQVLTANGWSVVQNEQINNLHLVAIEHKDYKPDYYNSNALLHSQAWIGTDITFKGACLKCLNRALEVI